jgi:hypothetical protein
MIRYAVPLCAQHSRLSASICFISKWVSYSCNLTCEPKAAKMGKNVLKGAHVRLRISKIGPRLGLDAKVARSPAEPEMGLIGFDDAVV